MVAPYEGHGLDPRMHAELAQHVVDVVADRFLAQVELLRDLCRRTAVLQQAQHLRLTRSECRVRPYGRVGRLVLDLPEDADHPLAAVKPDRAHLDPHSIALPADQYDFLVHDVRSPWMFFANSSRARGAGARSPPPM